MIVEICVDNQAQVIEAIQRGASRLELCRELEKDGLTPSVSDLITAKAIAGNIPIFAMVRCRPGNFVYTAEEKLIMLQEISDLLAAGADGIVTGALSALGEIDTEFCERAVEAALGRPVTFHKAFDACAEELEISMRKLTDCGIARVLSSGKAPSALDGVTNLTRMVQLGAPTVVVAGGVRTHNFKNIHQLLNAQEYHGRDPSICSVLRES